MPFRAGSIEGVVRDNRPAPATFNTFETVLVGVDDPAAVVIPPGVGHACKNGGVPGLVFNCPDRLDPGAGKKEPVDEVRHGDHPDTQFRLEDAPAPARRAG
jgi:hypothetical protein